MFNRILIPLDGSSNGEKVLEYLPHLVDPAKSTLELMHVIDYGHLATQRPVYLTAKDMLDARVEAEEYLGKAATRAKELGFAANTLVAEGAVVNQILDATVTCGASLLAMTTHGRTGLSHLVMGSVVEELVRKANVPVLTLRSHGENVPWLAGNEKIKNILVALDGSELAEQALPTARELAQENDALLHLLHVVTPLDIDQIAPPVATSKMLDKAAQMRFNLSDNYLETITEGLRLAEIKCRADVVLGDPARAIVEEVRKANIDLIVIATHGRAGLSHLLYGSVTEHVLRHAACPVVAVRVEEVEAEEMEEGVTS